MPVYSFPYRQRAFFACFPAPCGFCFYRFLTHPVGFVCSYPLAGVVFLVFPRPYPIGFSLFSPPPLTPLRPVFAVSRSFLSLASLVSVRLRSFVARRWAVRCRVPPVPVSSPVSIFDVCGGETVSVSWSGDYPVAWCCGDGGVVLSFRLAARFLSVRGAGSFSWFFHMELLGGLFEEEWVVCLRRDERRRTK